jgi:hypothetical protein
MSRNETPLTKTKYVLASSSNESTFMPYAIPRSNLTTVLIVGTMTMATLAKGNKTHNLVSVNVSFVALMSRGGSAFASRAIRSE